MMKSKLLNSLILAALAVPGVAMAEDSPFSGNVSLTTDYLYRGVTQTDHRGAIQGGFDYANPNGVYAGVWGSNISWLQDGGSYTAGASLELDTYAGYRNSFAEDFSYDVGFLRYNYSGELVPGTPTASTNEIYGLIGWKWVTLKYSYALGDTFGTPDAKGTTYVDLSGSYTLEGSGVMLGAHFGKQTYRGTAADNNAASGLDETYQDYNLSIGKDFSGYVVKLAYSDTNATAGGFYTITQADGSTTDLGKSTVVLSLSHSM